MLGNGDPEGERAQMSGLAKELDGSFSVAAFEFPVGGAHSAEILNLTMRANGLAGARRLANLTQAPVPSFRETRGAQVVAVLLGDHANAHAAARGDGTAVFPAAAGVFPGTQGSVARSQFVLGKLEVFGFSDRIAKFEFHGLFGSETNGQRALGTINARIDERVELECDADFLFRESLHFVDFMDIDGGWNSLKCQRQTAVLQQTNAPDAAIKGTLDASQGFVCPPCGAVQGDLDGEGAIFGKMIGNPRSDQRPVGEDGDEKAALLGLGVNIEEISPGEDLAAGVQNPETAKAGEFVKQAHVFGEGHFLLAGM